MRPFRLIELVTGAALSVSVAPFAGQPVLADSIETVPIEAWNGDSVCRADDTATGLKPSAMSEGGCPEHAPETDETARARAYLIETATPGYTMTRREKHFRKVPREDALQSAGSCWSPKAVGSLVL